MTDELLTKDEVARLLKLPNARAVLRLPIDRVVLGKRTIRWRRSAVEAYLATRGEKAA